MRTAYTFVFLPFSNFFTCDLFTYFIIKNPIFIILALLLELFMPMASYYIGEILSRKIEEQQVKHVSYKEVEVRGKITLWSVSKIVPEVVLNEELIGKPTKLIYKEKTSIAYIHILSMLCIVSIVYLTYKI